MTRDPPMCVIPGPSAPRQLTWLVVGSNGVHLSWLPPAKPNGIITSYIISYCSGASEAAVETATTAANCRTQNVHGELIVRFRTIAENGFGARKCWQMELMVLRSSSGRYSSS